MPKYFERIKTLPLSKEKKRKPAEKATYDQITSYRSLAGTSLYLGQAVLPQVCLVLSKMQQRLGYLRITDLLDANLMVKELLSLKPMLCFTRFNQIQTVMLTTLSDALQAGVRKEYEQSRIISGLLLKTSSQPCFYPLIWNSHKQKKVSYSSYGAEIIDAASADDIGYFLKKVFRELFPLKPIKNQFFLASKSLLETITTLHRLDEYRL